MARFEELKTVSAEAGRDAFENLKMLELKVADAERELAELEAELASKQLRESLHLSQIYEAQHAAELEKLVKERIEEPEAILKLYWEYLRLRVEPGGAGGVRVTMGFTADSNLPELRFNIKFSPETQYVVSDCDPMIIGMSELVDELNRETKSGALARFCCRIRARYTAQYSADFS